MSVQYSANDPANVNSYTSSKQAILVRLIDMYVDKRNFYVQPEFRTELALYCCILNSSERDRQSCNVVRAHLSLMASVCGHLFIIFGSLSSSKKIRVKTKLGMDVNYPFLLFNVPSV